MILLLVALDALGSPVYPPKIAELTGAPCEPVCTVCHESELGGAGTVVQPFGLAARDRGLEGGGDLALLEQVLAQLEDDEVDSDDDGIPDVEALAMGVDPNPGGASMCDVELPRYGCLSHAPAAPAGWLGLLAALGFLRRSRA